MIFAKQVVNEYKKMMFSRCDDVESVKYFSVEDFNGLRVEDYSFKASAGHTLQGYFYEYENSKVVTTTNNNGGILGGITNGMPIIFNVAIKPTASIFKEQKTVNIANMKEETLNIEGRHDPCIVQRALPVIEAVTAIGMLELINS